MKNPEEKKEKEILDDDDIDLEGNLNINEQIERISHNKKEEPKEKKPEKFEENKNMDLNLKKTQSDQKFNSFFNLFIFILGFF